MSLIPKVSALARLGAMGEANSGEGFKHWRSHLESRLRPTHRVFLKEILSQSMVFGTIIGVTRSLLLGAPHPPQKLWAEALKAAVYIRNRTPTDVLEGEAHLEV